jgi:hypothetical protein
MAAHYTDHLHQDPHINHVAFSAMTIERSWTTMQKWVINNWESYLIIHCGGINNLTFNHNQEDLLPYTAFTAPPCQFITTPDGKSINYGQKPVEAMQCLILQFSNPSNMIINAFAGMHTTSLTALLCHCHSIAFKASQEQWTSVQAMLPDKFLALSDEHPGEADTAEQDLPDLQEAAGLPNIAASMFVLPI